MIKAYIPVELELTGETVTIDKGWLGYPTVDICKGLVTCCDPKNGETQKVPIAMIVMKKVRSGHMIFSVQTQIAPPILQCQK